MGSQVGYYVAKIISKLKRDKYKEVLNRWFEKQGVHLVGGGYCDYNICSNIAKTSHI